MSETSVIPLQALFEIVREPGISIKGLSRKMGITDRHASRISTDLAAQGIGKRRQLLHMHRLCEIIIRSVVEPI